MDLDPDPIQQFHLGSRSRSNPFTDPFVEHFLRDHVSFFNCLSLVTHCRCFLMQVRVDFSVFCCQSNQNDCVYLVKSLKITKRIRSGLNWIGISSKGSRSFTPDPQVDLDPNQDPQKRFRSRIFRSFGPIL